MAPTVEGIELDPRIWVERFQDICNVVDSEADCGFIGDGHLPAFSSAQRGGNPSSC